MKICPTCEEPIPDDRETCGDEICESLLHNLIDSEYIREILRNLEGIQLDPNGAV
jgi:predicted nucleic acid-binding Zn ribbon protein